MYDVICLSHLRWDFVFQRPQHLLSRCARDRRVFYVEEQVSTDGQSRLDVTQSKEGVFVVVPRISESDQQDREAVKAKLLRELTNAESISEYVTWYYTPMALPQA